jgi:hypothetical protein
VPEIPEEYSPELNQIVQACMSREPAQRPTAEQVHQLTLVYLDKGKWEGFEKITNYKESIFPVGNVAAANPNPTGEGIPPTHNTEAHPDLQIDVEGADDNEVPVVRSERVTEAVNKKKQKAVAAPGKRTFDRNVYMFLGAVMIVLIVLIGREYVQGNKNGNEESLMAANDTLATKANDRPTDIPQKVVKQSENSADNDKEAQKAKDLQEQLRLMEEKFKEQEKMLKEKDNAKEEISSDIEFIDETNNIKIPPPPPNTPNSKPNEKPALVITKEGVIISDDGKKAIKINLPKEIIKIVKEASKTNKSKKKLDEWSRKMSKKYEHLGKEYSREYMRKKAEMERKKELARRKANKYDYEEEHPSCYLIQQGDKWGYLDRRRKLIVRPQYEQAWAFREGLAAVKKYGKWGYINRYGKTVIGHKFTKASYFTDGKAKVTYKGKQIYINRYGKCVQDCQ